MATKTRKVKITFPEVVMIEKDVQQIFKKNKRKK
jgi:hypothetical protein